MIVAMLPAYFRFAQCLRRYRDSKEAFPHLANAGESEDLSNHNRTMIEFFYAQLNTRRHSS